MLKDRQKSILQAVIQEHIRTAKPVASRELLDGFRFGLSPATIRNEMFALDRLGYLEQPYTSAGRIPTDRGYRFFVDNLIAEANLEAAEQRLLNRIFEMEDEDEFVHGLGKAASQLSRTFSAVGIFGEDIFYETGFLEFLTEPEFQGVENIRAFGRLADMLDEKIRDIAEEFNDLEGKIFIGEENPLKEARSCAMVLSSWHHPRGFSGFLTLLAPKRTNYSRHKAFIRSVKKASDEQ